MKLNSSFIPNRMYVQVNLLWYVGGIITGWLLKKLDYWINKGKE